MRGFLLCVTLFILSQLLHAQTYLISAGGTVNNACSGNFYDSGGSGGSYSNNENFTMSFCATAGNCLSINIILLDLRNDDVLTIFDGPNTSSPVAYTCNGCNVTGTLLSTSGCLTFRFTSNGSNVDPGWNIQLSCVPCPVFHSNSTLNTCAATYYDNGGLNNYPNNTNTLQVICPSTPGQFVSLNFTQFELENNYDYLFIHNGNSPSADLIGVYTGTTSPGTVTSSVAGGCLAIRFFSDGSGTRPGWQANVTCSATPGPPPTASAQDCGGGGGTTICSNSSFTANSSGLGMNELTQTGFWGGAFPWAGCLAAGERQSSWYYFSPSSSGTIGFSINPTVATDYDFAIWGPYTQVSCPAFTGDSPLRCSYAAGTGATGLGNGATDFSEGSGGDGWVAPISVTAGQVYVMVISNFSASSNPFTMSWNLSGGASLNCTPLPVKTIAMYGENKGNYNIVKWSTASETNNDYFIIEKSKDGKNFTELTKVKGAGNSTVINDYSIIDDKLSFNITYYRISQIDFDGTTSEMGIVAVKTTHSFENLSFHPNPVSNNAEINFNSNVNGISNIQVIDITGKQVYTESINTNEGSNRFVLNTDNFNKGLYFLVISNEFGTEKLKFIKE